MSTVDDVDLGRRRFLTATATVVGGVGVAFVAVPFLKSWSPSERAKAAGAPVEADISKLEEGAMMTVEWRGKPVWLLKRSQKMLDDLPSLKDQLLDPNSEMASQQPKYAQNANRSVKPERTGAGRHLHPSRLLADLPARRGPGGSGSRVEGRILLPLPRLPLRPGRAGLQGRSRAIEPGGALLPVPERFPRIDWR